MKTIASLIMGVMACVLAVPLCASAEVVTRLAGVGGGKWDTTTLAWTNSAGVAQAWNNANWDVALLAAESYQLTNTIYAGGISNLGVNMTLSATAGNRLVLRDGAVIDTDAGWYYHSLTAPITGTNLTINVRSGFLYFTGSNSLSGTLTMSSGRLCPTNSSSFAGITALTNLTGALIINTTNNLFQGTMYVGGSGVANAGCLTFDPPVGTTSIVYQAIELMGATRFAIGGGGTGPSPDFTGIKTGIILGQIGGSSALSFVGRAGSVGTNRFILAATNNFSGSTTLGAIEANSFVHVDLSEVRALQNSTYANTYTNGTLRFSGITEAILGGLSGNQPIALTNLAGQAVQLSVGNNNSSQSYSNALSAAGGLTKVGTGVFTLVGTNTYSGQTVVSNGTLKLAGTGSITNSPVVNVASGAVFDVSAWAAGYTNRVILEGQGVVSGAVTVVSGAGVSGGLTNGIGTLTFAQALTLKDGALLYWNVGANTQDLVQVNGALTLPAALTVKVSRVGEVPWPSRAPVIRSAGTIANPPDLSGWTLEGVPGSRLTYDATTNAVLISTLRGTCISIQ